MNEDFNKATTALPRDHANKDMKADPALNTYTDEENMSDDFVPGTAGKSPKSRNGKRRNSFDQAAAEQQELRNRVEPPKKYQPTAAPHSPNRKGTAQDNFRGTKAEVLKPNVDVRNLVWEESYQKPLPTAIWKRPAFQGESGVNDFKFL